MGEVRTISLHLPCASRYLALAREAALEFCLSAGLAEFSAYQVEMAVDEACTNVIEHSYGGEVPPREEARHPGIRVHFREHDDRIQVEIIDRGAGFDFQAQPVVAPEAYLESGTECGLGMYTISQFVDAVDYQNGTPEGNRLLLTKRL